MIGSKEFKERVTNALLNTNVGINLDFLYFSQLKDNYTLAYIPDYPNQNIPDFSIMQHPGEPISILYNENSALQKYTNLDSFEGHINTFIYNIIVDRQFEFYRWQ